MPIPTRRFDNEGASMSSDTTNQTTTSSESVNIESDEDTLARLNDLLARNPEATVGEQDSEDFSLMSASTTSGV
jgi:hypothetical protein